MRPTWLIMSLVLVTSSTLSAQQISYEEYHRLQQTVKRQEARLQQLESNASLQRLPEANSPARSSRLISDESFVDLHNNVTFNNNDDLADRLSALEDELSDTQDSLKEYVKSGSSKSRMKVVGRVHADMWAFPEDSPGVNEIETGDPNVSPQDRLGFRRMRFGVRGTLPANMEYRIEMELAGGNDVEFRDAWLGWNELPVIHTLLIGNQKRPYGLDHLNSSRYNVFLERPFVIESFNQDARRLGICAYGLSEDQRWNWRYGVYNLRLIQDEGQYISARLKNP